MRVLHIYIILAFVITSCKNEPIITEINPPAAGFNLVDSDTKAIAIADEVMEANGGRAAYDATNTLKWTFFGNREHEWNKANENAKIYDPRNDIKIDINLKTKEGKVTKAGVAYTDTDSLAHFLDLGYKWWINDSYWLVMPFKLKDSGVTLKYVGKKDSQAGRSSDVLSLSFENVGVTPNNMYHVYVDDSSRLVTQWDFYVNASDSLPRFQSPWAHYKKYGDILLSGGSIGDRKLSDISVE